MTPISVDANQNQGREFRTSTASTKVTEAELNELEQAAASSSMKLGEWIRDVLLRAAKSATGTVTPEHILTEIVGLQLFLTNALSPVACGGRLSAEQYQELMRNVKIHKHRAVREVIAQYVAGQPEEHHG